MEQAHEYRGRTQDRQDSKSASRPSEPSPNQKRMSETHPNSELSQAGNSFDLALAQEIAGAHERPFSHILCKRFDLFPARNERQAEL